MPSSGEISFIGSRNQLLYLISLYNSTYLNPNDQCCLVAGVVPILASSADAAAIHPFTHGRKKQRQKNDARADEKSEKGARGESSPTARRW